MPRASRVRRIRYRLTPFSRGLILGSLSRPTLLFFRLVMSNTIIGSLNQLNELETMIVTKNHASGVTNRTQPDRWKADIILSVDMYNTWFMNFAPAAYRETRVKVTEDVIKTLQITSNLSNISNAVLKANPEVLPTLRMSTCPPIAVDR